MRIKCPFIWLDQTLVKLLSFLWVSELGLTLSLSQHTAPPESLPPAANIGFPQGKTFSHLLSYHASSFADIVWLLWPNQTIQFSCKDTSLLRWWVLSQSWWWGCENLPPLPHFSSIMSLPDVSARLIGCPFLFMSHLSLAAITPTFWEKEKNLYH